MDLMTISSSYIVSIYILSLNLRETRGELLHPPYSIRGSQFVPAKSRIFLDEPMNPQFESAVPQGHQPNSVVDAHHKIS